MKLLITYTFPAWMCIPDHKHITFYKEYVYIDYIYGNLGTWNNRKDLYLSAEPINFKFEPTTLKIRKFIYKYIGI